MPVPYIVSYNIDMIYRNAKKERYIETWANYRSYRAQGQTPITPDHTSTSTPGYSLRQRGSSFLVVRGTNLGDQSLCEFDVLSDEDQTLCCLVRERRALGSEEIASVREDALEAGTQSHLRASRAVIG